MSFLKRLFKKKPPKPTLLDIQWEASDIVRECNALERKVKSGEMTVEEARSQNAELDLRIQVLNDKMKAAGIAPPR